MGIIQCPKHGLQDIAINIQADVCAKILNNEKLTEKDLCVIKVLVYDAGQLLVEMNYLILAEVQLKMGLENQYIVVDENEQDDLRLLNSMSGALCTLCFAEYPHRKNINRALHDYESYQ